ncbi:MAG: DUF262 domain-containing protein, partial [Alphaproteobacteria bacterium GM7ARS4]|nr:DUF262 domain-containing protein [Alphaproteobacteria bacterium GM7ARS4]
EGDNVERFQFYEFIKDYKKDEKHNTPASLSGRRHVTAILDGQQRLTAMYMALTGSYTSTKYPKKLHLNIFQKAEEEDLKYDFQFLTDKEAEKKNKEDDVYWFRCEDIMPLKKGKDVSRFLKDNVYPDLQEKSKQDFAHDTLHDFCDAIHANKIINYYQEESQDLEKVLQIFIRANSGGTKLSYSDLLFSMTVAQWKERDARETILKFVDDINGTGRGFDINKDVVLKNCLVLADYTKVAFKVTNFNEKMEKIEEEWDNTSSALQTAITLVARYGYEGKSFASKNAIIPISYFIYRNKLDENTLLSPKQAQNRKDIMGWLARALHKAFFSFHFDNEYPILCELIDTHKGRFPLQEMIEKYRGKTKTLSFSEDDIDSILESQYGKKTTYSVLTLLYLGLGEGFVYEQDHIHPRASFTKTSMRKQGFSDEQIEAFNKQKDSMANLQLLEKKLHVFKGNKAFDTWLNEEYPAKEKREDFLRRNFIDSEQSLAFKDFPEFIKARRQLLKGELKRILGVT